MLRNGSKGASIRGSLDWESGILPLSYSAPQSLFYLEFTLQAVTLCGADLSRTISSLIWLTPAEGSSVWLTLAQTRTSLNCKYTLRNVFYESKQFRLFSLYCVILPLLFPGWPRMLFYPGYKHKIMNLSTYKRELKTYLLRMIFHNFYICFFYWGRYWIFYFRHFN